MRPFCVIIRDVSTQNPASRVLAYDSELEMAITFERAESRSDEG